MNTRCLSLILLLLLCAVPLASAGGMAKVYLSPDMPAGKQARQSRSR